MARNEALHGGWRRRALVRVQLEAQRRPLRLLVACACFFALAALVWGRSGASRRSASTWARAAAVDVAARVDSAVHRYVLLGVPRMHGQGAVVEEHADVDGEPALVPAPHRPTLRVPVGAVAGDGLRRAPPTVPSLNCSGTAAAGSASAPPPPPKWSWIDEMAARAPLDASALLPAYGGGATVRELLLPTEAARAALAAAAAVAAHGAGADGFTSADPPSLTWTMTPRQTCDTELLLSGAFSPLGGYMDRRAVARVVSDMRLPPRHPMTGGGWDGSNPGDAVMEAACSGEAGNFTGFPGVAACARRAARAAARDASAEVDSEVDVEVEHGLLWPIPIVLDLPAAVGDRLRPGSTVYLRDAYFNFIAAVTVTDAWRPDTAAEAAAVYGTSDAAHPGVAALYRGGAVYVGGPLAGARLPLHLDHAALRRTPAEMRVELARRGWTRSVAFQTRNPMHRAHIELTRLAAAEARAGVVLHPVVGVTKPGDVEAALRVQCYQAILPPAGGGVATPGSGPSYYDPRGALLSLLPLAMRMAGPREAVLHAIVRRNHGFTHFIVGRDHAGVGGFYGPYDAQTLVATHQAELGIRMLAYQEIEYLPVSGQFVPADRVPAGAATASISGTKFRALMAAGDAIPQWFSDPRVIALLRASSPPRAERGFVVFFTGLSGSGKTTLAGALASRLAALLPTRRVRLLDGDVVRTHLSKGLGLSLADRITHVSRMGWVASELAAQGGIVLMSAIAPLAEARSAARNHAATAGTGIGDGVGWFDVHVATPIRACADRDVKGLYRAAAAAAGATTNATSAPVGRSADVTGVSHPWEAPATPDIVIDTSAVPAVDDATTLIVAAIARAGYIHRPLPRAPPTDPAALPLPPLSPAELALATTIDFAVTAAAASAAAAGTASAAGGRIGGAESTDALSRVFPSLPLVLPRPPPAAANGANGSTGSRRAASAPSRDVDSTRRLCAPLWDAVAMPPPGFGGPTLWAGRPSAGSVGAAVLASEAEAEAERVATADGDNADLAPSRLSLMIEADLADDGGDAVMVTGELADRLAAAAVAAAATGARRSDGECVPSDLTLFVRRRDEDAEARHPVTYLRVTAPGANADAACRVRPGDDSPQEEVGAAAAGAHPPASMSTAHRTIFLRANDDFVAAVERHISSSATGPSRHVAASDSGALGPLPAVFVPVEGPRETAAAEAGGDDEPAAAGGRAVPPPPPPLSWGPGDRVAAAWDLWTAFRWSAPRVASAAARGGADAAALGGRRHTAVVVSGPRLLPYARHFLQFDPCFTVALIGGAPGAATLSGGANTAGETGSAAAAERWRLASRALAADYPDRVLLYEADAAAST